MPVKINEIKPAQHFNNVFFCNKCVVRLVEAAGQTCDYCASQPLIPRRKFEEKPLIVEAERDNFPFLRLLVALGVALILLSIISYVRALFG